MLTIEQCVECDKSARYKGLCPAHYSKQLRNSHTTICIVDGCNKIGHTKKYCHAHYAKILRYGSIDYNKKNIKKGSAHYAWKDKPSYGAVHARIKRYRGFANQFNCIDCNGPAQDWSLNLNCNYELIEERGRLVPISYNTNDYDPRCKRCHGIYDGWIENLSWWNEYADA